MIKHNYVSKLKNVMRKNIKKNIKKNIAMMHNNVRYALAYRMWEIIRDSG